RALRAAGAVTCGRRADARARRHRRADPGARGNARARGDRRCAAAVRPREAARRERERHSLHRRPRRSRRPRVHRRDSPARDVLPIYGSAGFIAKLSPLVSLLAEPAIFAVAGTGDNNIDSSALAVLDYGVRLSGKNFGVDLTFIKSVAKTGEKRDDPLLLGYPFLAFTYRTDGDARTSTARGPSAA